MNKETANWRLRKNARAQVLIHRIEFLTPAERDQMAPFPPEWQIDHQSMILLVDAGYLGMDGFQYCFREYAHQCWRVCHRKDLKV